MKKLLIIVMFLLPHVAMANIVDDSVAAYDQRMANNRAAYPVPQMPSPCGIHIPMAPVSGAWDPTWKEHITPRDMTGTFYIGPNGSYSPNMIYTPPPYPGYRQ